MILKRHVESQQLRSEHRIHILYVNGDMSARQAQVELIGVGIPGRDATNTVIEWIDEQKC